MLRIYLTGNVTIETASGTISDWRATGRQGRLAFAMLAADYPRAVPRDELIEGLWPDAVPPSSDKALTAIISKVRALLDSIGDPDIGIVSAFGTYQIRLPTDAWIDIQAAAEAIDAAEGALRNGEPKAAWPHAQITCHVARRAILPGDDGPWLERVRRDLRVVGYRAHECLASIYIATGEFATAAIHAGQAIELEPFRETAYLLLVRAHAGAGNRAEALRTYERCRALLAEELGVSPASSIESAYLAILSSTP